MKKLQLNIGLIHHDKRNKNTARETVAAIRHAGFGVIRHRVVQGTEPTLAALVAPVETSTDDMTEEIYNLALALSQGCIAWHDGKRGHLTGPQAAAWGKFNSKLFVSP
jgi:hypothetical protein